MDILDKILDTWDTKRGLIAYSILTLSVVGIPTISDIIKKRPEDLVLPGGILLVLWIPFFAFWKYRRSVGTLRKRINIIFAYHGVTETENIWTYYKNFQIDFKDKLQTLGIHRARIIFWPLDKRIKSEQEAEALVKKGFVGHTIMIWGTLQDFGGEVICKKNHFSYEFRYQRYFPPLNDEQLRKRFGSTIQKVINTFDWNYNLSRRNDFTAYTNNIADIAAYVLSRTLISAGEVKLGTSILTSTLASLKSLSLVERHQRGPLIGTVERDLAIIHELIAYNYKDRDNTQMESHCEASLTYNPSSYGANLLMGYIQERLHGETKKAKEFIRRAEMNAIRGQNAHLFSYAFLALKENDFNKAIEFYNRLYKYNLDTVSYIPAVAEDCYREYEITKNPIFLFADGLISSTWLPGNKGKNKLNKFLRLIKNAPQDYEPLRIRAKKLIEES